MEKIVEIGVMTKKNNSKNLIALCFKVYTSYKLSCNILLCIQIRSYRIYSYILSYKLDNGDIQLISIFFFRMKLDAMTDMFRLLLYLAVLF